MYVYILHEKGICTVLFGGEELDVVMLTEQNKKKHKFWGLSAKGAE